MTTGRGDCLLQRCPARTVRLDRGAGRRGRGFGMGEDRTRGAVGGKPLPNVGRAVASPSRHRRQASRCSHNLRLRAQERALRSARRDMRRYSGATVVRPPAASRPFRSRRSAPPAIPRAGLPTNEAHAKRVRKRAMRMPMPSWRSSFSRFLAYTQCRGSSWSIVSTHARNILSPKGARVTSTRGAGEIPQGKTAADAQALNSDKSGAVAILIRYPPMKCRSRSESEER